MTAGPEAVTIRFTDDRRPEAATLVRLEQFDGPLGLLLALIEQRQLDILTVRLGELAGAYLEALAALPGERLPHLSAFVAVAAQLILIKSRALLPQEPVPPAASPEGPDPELELRRRLVVYRAFRDAGRQLEARLEEPSPLFHREAGPALAAGLAGARPAPQPPLDPAVLVEALARAIVLVPPPAAAPEILARTVTLAERAEAIRAALRRASTVVLQELLAGTTDRVVVTVTFLALLELVKRREVVAEQAQPWGPIRCRRTSAAERAAAGFPVGPAGPIDETLEDFA
ncbi:MAG TPA: ScpA family protein [Candidatus Dormibacteraeota bacterium]|nr:ScpA family protein [Candidatus Dormibacteraeota bacterium]